MAIGHRPPAGRSGVTAEEVRGRLLAFCLGATLVLVGQSLLPGGGSETAVQTEISVPNVLSRMDFYRNRVRLDINRRVELLSNSSILTGYVIAADLFEISGELYLTLLDQIGKCPALQVGGTVLSGITSDARSYLEESYKSCWTGEHIQVIMRDVVFPVFGGEEDGEAAFRQLWAECAVCSTHNELSSCSECGKLFHERLARFVQRHEHFDPREVGAIERAAAAAGQSTPLPPPPEDVPAEAAPYYAEEAAPPPVPEPTAAPAIDMEGWADQFE